MGGLGKLLVGCFPWRPEKVMESTNVGRWLLTEEGLAKGFLKISEGIVSELCYGDPPADSLKAVVLPSFVNAHTHIGDSIAYPAPRGSVEDVVGPPYGYKHRILRSGSRSAKVDAMRASIRLMLATGTSVFADFREEGLEGVRQLAEALDRGPPKAVVLGRPASLDDPQSDIDLLIESCDGIGMSALRDWPLDFMKDLARRAQSKRKLFSVHASESVREDIGSILELKPDFVIHMTSASEADIAECAEAGVPIVVCPRSNEFFGIRPDIPRMVRLGATVGLGTDNCMISRPEMLEEIKAAYRISKQLGGLSSLEAVELATYHGRKILNANGNIATGIHEKGDLTAIRVRGEDPLAYLVTEARSGDIQAVIHEGKVQWRSENWTK